MPFLHLQTPIRGPEELEQIAEMVVHHWIQPEIRITSLSRDLWHAYYVPGTVQGIECAQSQMLSCLEVYCKRKKSILFGNWIDFFIPNTGLLSYIFTA